MFVPSDKYITINEDRAKYLVETFGEDAVEEKTSFSFEYINLNWSLSHPQPVKNIIKFLLLFWIFPDKISKLCRDIQKKVLQ